MREHGTKACYAFGPEPGAGKGCRCEPCRTAIREYERQRARRTAPAYVEADSARRHVEWLRDQGVGLKTIARAAGVSHGALSKLVYGGHGRAPSKRIRKATQDAILAVTPGNAADGARVPAGPTWAIVRTLLDRGWTKVAIAHAIGQTGQGLQLAHTTVSARNARAVADLLDQPVPEPKTRTGLGARAAKAYHERQAEPPDPNDDLAEVIAARTEVDRLPVIDPTVFDAAWRDRAACRLLDAAERWMFWPSATDDEAIEAAKAVCARCAVRGDCLAYALDAREVGVWGGTTDDERAYLIAVPDPDERWLHERWVALGRCGHVLPGGAWCDRDAGHLSHHRVGGATTRASAIVVRPKAAA